MTQDMTPVDWAKRPILEKYADFSGRAPRAELWWCFLALVIAYVVAAIIESILGMRHMIAGMYGPLSCLLWLATIIPSIAVGVRRLHDTGRPGWWVLLPLIPEALMIVMALATVLNWAIDILALLLHLVSVSRLFMNETNANSMPSAWVHAWFGSA